MNPGDKEAEAKFKEASEAYAVLSDADKRRQYDQFGHAAFEGGAGGAGGGGFDFDFGDMGDIFGDIFGGMFGGGSSSRRNSNGPRRGADIRVNVRITFAESVTGTKKKIDVTLKDECSKCHGTGAKPGTSPETCKKCGGRGQVTVTQQSFLGMMRSVQPCPDCHGTGKIVKEKCPDCYGTGYISSKKTIEVNIPAGIDNGQCVRIQGKGEPGTNGGPRGDLLVAVMISADPAFERDGYNIFSDVVISYPTAVLSLIAVVGRGMRNNSGLAANIFSALAKAKINIKMIDQGSSELNIIIGVRNRYFEDAIKTIYDVFVPNNK